MSSVQFISQQAEAKLVEQIGAMQQSGVVMTFDPTTMTAIHVLVKVTEREPPRMVRWSAQGPTTLEAARAMSQEISNAASADADRIRSSGFQIN